MRFKARLAEDEAGTGAEGQGGLEAIYFVQDLAGGPVKIVGI
jgi:hypothetical protein